MQAMLAHTSTKFKRYFPEIEVNLEDSMFLSIEIDTRDYQDGEYQLTIYTDRNEVIGEEIIKIGDYSKMENTQYKVEKKFTTYVRK